MGLVQYTQKFHSSEGKMNKLIKIILDIKTQKKEIECYEDFSLNNLMIFVMGVTYKLWENGEKDLEFLPGFYEFILKFYGLDQNDKIFQNKIEIINFFSHNDEDALNKFYDLLDKFLYSKGINL